MFDQWIRVDAAELEVRYWGNDYLSSVRNDSVNEHCA